MTGRGGRPSIHEGTFLQPLVGRWVRVFLQPGCEFNGSTTMVGKLEQARSDAIEVRVEVGKTTKLLAIAHDSYTNVVER